MDNQDEKAEEILDLSIEKMPINYLDIIVYEPYISTYYSLNKYDKGDNLYSTLSDKYIQSKYYSQLSTSKFEIINLCSCGKYNY